MSNVVERGLKKAGLKLDGTNALPREQRTVKAFQRLIQAMRSAEAEVNDRLSDSERQLNEALQKNLELQDRVRLLELEVVQHRLHGRLAEMGSLTVADRVKLLEVADPGRNGNTPTNT